MFTEKDKREKYNDIFEKRFKKNTDLSTTKEEPEFFTDYVNKILDGYKDIITEKRNNNDNNYIKREKIRLEANLKNLERKSFDNQNMISLITIFITVSIFGISYLFNNILDSVKFKIETAIKNLTNQSYIEKFAKIFADTSNGVRKLALVGSIALIVIVFIYIFMQDFINRNNREKNDIDITFNRMCLEVLNNFEDEIR